MDERTRELVGRWPRALVRTDLHPGSVSGMSSGKVTSALRLVSREYERCNFDEETVVETVVAVGAPSSEAAAAWEQVRRLFDSRSYLGGQPGTEIAQPAR